MSPQEPTPTPDDEIAVIARALCDLPDTCTLHREKAARILDALKSAGYELVNQVGTYWPPTIMEPEEFDTLKAELDAEDAANLVELTARWLGERESTHLWPEIREDDKACYRDAARHLLATISGEEFKFCEPIAKGAFIEAVTPRAAAEAERVAKQERRLANTRERASLAANNWLTRMLENTNTVCVQLPEPDEHGCWYIDGTNDWLVHTGANGTGVFFETSVDLYEFAPDHAGNVAAALLAAKAKVEAGE